MEKNETNKKGLQAESKRGQQPSGIESEKTLEETVTVEKLAALKIGFSALSGESVTVEVMGDDLYIFGSELACLRLAYQYRQTPDLIRAQYSENLRTWYFALYRKFSGHEC